MNREEIEPMICVLVADFLEVDQVSVMAATALGEDLHLDREDLGFLANALEVEFGISIADEELYGLVTVGDLVELVTLKVQP